MTKPSYTEAVRSVHLGVRLTPAEYALLGRMASADSRPLSAYARLVLLRHIALKEALRTHRRERQRPDDE